MSKLSLFQLEAHIRLSAQTSANLVFTKHARLRMKQRCINDPMVLETLRKGRILIEPEPDSRYTGLVCRMNRHVAGEQVAVVLNVAYPDPTLIIITVLDVRKG